MKNKIVYSLIFLLIVVGLYMTNRLYFTERDIYTLISSSTEKKLLEQSIEVIELTDDDKLVFALSSNETMFYGFYLNKFEVQNVEEFHHESNELIAWNYFENEKRGLLIGQINDDDIDYMIINGHAGVERHFEYKGSRFFYDMRRLSQPIDIIALNKGKVAYRSVP